MPTMLGRGECGGHLTLVFTIEDSSDDLLWQGSRGVGTVSYTHLTLPTKA